MHIVWNQEVVDRLKEKHVLLPLETFKLEDRDITCYCLVPTEKIGIEGWSNLDRYKELHEHFVQAYYNKEYDFCRGVALLLKGQFGGELDSFYDEILSRLELAE
jgi:hypothetical protein